MVQFDFDTPRELSIAHRAYLSRCRLRERRKTRENGVIGNPTNMTVCIAALCQHQGAPAIVGVSDAMLTQGNIEYESDQSKFCALAPTVVAMVAGNIAPAVPILHDTVQSMRETEGGKATTVKALADRCAQNFSRFRLSKAESDHLAPIGLKLTDLHNPTIQTSVLDDALQFVQSFELRTTIMIAGIDHLGAHIYAVGDPGVVTYTDVSSYHVIGTGSALAIHQFQSAGHTRATDISDGIFTSYNAKRTAEVASGVGPKTHMFCIGTGIFILGDEHIRFLSKTYDGILRQYRKIGQKAYQRVRDHLNATLLKPTEPRRGGS